LSSIAMSNLRRQKQQQRAADMANGSSPAATQAHLRQRRRQGSRADGRDKLSKNERSTVFLLETKWKRTGKNDNNFRCSDAVGSQTKQSVFFLFPWHICFSRGRMMAFSESNRHVAAVGWQHLGSIKKTTEKSAIDQKTM
jgi:hypothetical protein